MKLRLSKFFWGISLRQGCFLIAFTSVCMKLVHLSYGPIPLVYQFSVFVYSFHLSGCICLWLSAAIMSPMIVVYLFADLLHIVFSCSVAYFWVNDKSNTLFEIVMNFVYMALSVYFWLVAYSYFKQCRDNVLPEVTERMSTIILT
ncbi:uncharacterized protein LOC108606095 isoform X2 [Drosophila busckii]|uniref:uncharacterized protein LOC108606095 isoform X2 n=1 Tax=Drosophila busckii TaxID=30019 RepID=UPI00083EAB1F|nr:uncharacterized protein LOC108606095 isoform X2 [Drosophila busckii]